MDRLTLGNTENGMSNLLEQITDESQLQVAWKLVKANRGAAGVDGQTLEKFESKLKEELTRLRQEVLAWTYRPQAVRRVEIPKPGSREKRKLGIPTVRDRVLQQSIRLSLEPLYEPEFSEWSFGFRPGRGQQMAIEAAQRMVASGKDWVVDIDLEKFFDRINHDRLIHTLKLKVKDKRVLRLIGMILRSGVMCRGNYEDTTEGSPQGSPLSPLLSNIVLDELDKELEKRGLMFCRYADDAKIFVGSRKAGNRVMRSISILIEKRLKLVVNRTKSQVAPTKEVTFLGFVVLGREVLISPKSLKRANAKLRELIPRRTNVTFENQIERFNQWYRGWSSYYKLTSYPDQLYWVEAHARRRFRAQLVRNAKRPRTLIRKLLSLGVRARLARSSVCAGKRGTWRLSHTRAADIGWNNQWFRSRGFIERCTAALPHWKPLSVYLK
jgi:RNA-directed DNA polymerase